MTSEGRELVADTPLGGLPASERVLLRRAQIEVALAEVRYSTGRDDVTADEGLELRELLEGAGVVLPRLQPAEQQQVSLNVGPGGAATSEVEVRARGWQMISADGHLIATVMPDVIAVQTTKYERWSVSLRPTLEALLGAVEQVLAPDLVQRVGLRYVNRLVDVDAVTAKAWIGRINPAVLGAVTDEVLGPRLVTTQQQLELTLGDAQGALVRHGAFRDGAVRGAYSYLIDIDVFDGESNRFAVADILLQAQQLNRTALSLFRQIVTPQYLAEMEPYSETKPSGNVTEQPGGE